MLKKGLVALVGLTVMSAAWSWAATAYQLQTKLSNAGGKLQVRSNGAQTAAGSTIFTNFTTSANVAVVVTPNAGYKISALTKNGAAVTLADPTVPATAGFVKTNGTVQSLVATFAQQSLAIATPAGVTPTNPAAVYNGSVVLTATPTGSNNLVNSITLSDPSKATVTLSQALPYAGPVKVTLSNITGNVTVSAVYGIDPRLAMYNACATCHAGSSTPAVVAVQANWAGSDHADNNVTCITCHQTMPGPALTSANNCETCHTGANAVAATSAQVAAWQKSSHTIANNGFENVSCSECHNPHNLVATATDDKTDSCSACHTDKRSVGAGNYSIYSSASRLVLKAPHGGGKAAPAAGAVNLGDSTTQYLTNGAICTDCHGHNNAINGGFGAGGHGEVSSEALNPFAHYDWSGKTNNGTRQNSNCDRCHTAVGFIKLLNGDAALQTRLALQVGKPNNVLICVGCHTNLDTGALRIDATPAGNGQALSAGYFALFSSASPTTAGTQGQVAANKTKIQIAFPGMKNSSICVPCHSGRSTAAVFTAVIDQAKLVNKNYTTIQTSYYQHAKNIGQTFISQGAYDITGKLAAITANGPSNHAAVKMGATDNQGACVGCHYSTLTATGINNATHSLAVNSNSPTCLAAACHTTAPDVAGAKASFDAGVAALDALIRVKFAPLQTVAGQDLSTERANIRFGRFGGYTSAAKKATAAKAAYGAWYNWQILATYDNAAFVHNPRYARQILNDTLGFLQTGAVKTSYAGADVNAAIAAGLAATPASIPAATSFVVAPGCAACHAAKVTSFTTTGGYHATVKQYSCANCHTELHMSAIPGPAAPTCRCHGDVAGGATPTLDAVNAPTANCATCHGSTDVHTMKAASASGKGCVDCHLGALTHTGGKVADNNNGVRAIIPEFQKTSHHIYNGPTALPTDAQCAICHLEGQAVNGAVVMDPAFHMKDAKIHLRMTNSATDAEFAWDPSAAAPDQSGMDNFCFSCHNATGATSPKIAGIQAVIIAANPAGLATPATQVNAGNPFGDLLSNKYDQVTRAQVVDVDSAFTSTNASHHAVKAQKYTIRTTSAAMAAAGQKTLFDGGLFVSDYTPLGAIATVGDDSQLHCGDCHTVGQWKANTDVATNKYNSAAIGAHGSVNEYMLRNNLGTDALHNMNTYVCFNCHSDKGNINNVVDTAGGYYSGSTTAGGTPTVMHAQGIHAGLTGDFQNTAGNIGNAVSATGRLGGNMYLGVSKATSQGNITGISCTACHNSGIRNKTQMATGQNPTTNSGFGGIHGGNATYSSKGIGVNLGSATQSPARFMSGMNNFAYVPASNDLSNTTNPNKPQSSVAGTCYTSATATENAGYGSCTHHGGGTAVLRQGGSVGNVARPLSY